MLHQSRGKAGAMQTSPTALIEKKRDGGEHSSSEIRQLIELFLSGALTDYQMSAWLMATYLRGLSDDEMVALTRAMLESGSVLTLPRVRAPKIDKHSTGGVGDKISLALAPLVASVGVAVPMISGRGLGHTGGTLDKLEAIPGYDTRISAKRFERQVERIGVAIMGQTAEIAPADRRIYALRDVTGTVACRPLIVASILSKKLAAGLDGLVLDVKVGRGAFMKTSRSAAALADSLVRVAAHLGTPAVARLTAMETPLGTTIGNALEVHETIAILRGEGPKDTTELTLELGAEMLVLAGTSANLKEARACLQRALDSGAGLERFAQLIEHQGGDARVVDRPALLPHTKQRVVVEASRRGFVREIDPLALAQVALALGAGRRRAEDRVDPAVGVELVATRGERVSRGQPLAVLHLRKSNDEAAKATRAAFTLGDEAPRGRRLMGRRFASA